MNSIYLSASNKVLDGLRDMMEAALGPHEYIFPYVDITVALLVTEVAKRAEDKPEWFPHGKWATIQNIQAMVEEQLNQLFQTPNN